MTTVMYFEIDYAPESLRTRVNAVVGPTINYVDDSRKPVRLAYIRSEPFSAETVAEAAAAARADCEAKVAAFLEALAWTALAWTALEQAEALKPEVEPETIEEG